MVGWASAGFAEEIELTGLIDLPGCRSACFKLSSKQLEISLHPGERAEGIVLQDLDAQAGWAKFVSQGGATQVWLRSFCAPATPSPFAGRKIVASSRRQQADPNASGGNRVSPALPTIANAEAVASYANPLFNSEATFAGPRSNTGLSEAAKSQIPTGGAGVPENGSSGENVVALNSTTLPANGMEEAAPARLRATKEDPIMTEVERIRMLYGQAGFLAWDLARGQANLPAR